MNQAKQIACDVLFHPADIRYQTDTRIFQGCPTLAVTRGGRIYLGWYAGGTREPHMHNYNLLIYSDDDGKTWSDPLLVIPSSYEHCIHALDIQLFIDPKGALHVCWVQNNTQMDVGEAPVIPSGRPYARVDGWRFPDFEHSEWEIVCENPDAAAPIFTAPRYLCPGFLRCKPTFLENGDWLFFAYDQLSDRYQYNISTDFGKTFSRHAGPQKLATPFDETMAYQMDNGTVRLFARTTLGCIAQCDSFDNGRTWTDAVDSGIIAANTRLFVRKLPSGRVLLIYNEDPAVRKNMTIALSEDDGNTWKYKTCIDMREAISYPDADYHNGVIYLSYDRGRTTHREILFAKFTEEDIINSNSIDITLVSKPKIRMEKTDVLARMQNQGAGVFARFAEKSDEQILLKSLDDENALDEIARFADAQRIIGACGVKHAQQIYACKLAGAAFVCLAENDPRLLCEANACGLAAVIPKKDPSLAFAPFYAQKTADGLAFLSNI